MQAAEGGLKGEGEGISDTGEKNGKKRKSGEKESGREKRREMHE